MITVRDHSAPSLSAITLRAGRKPLRMCHGSIADADVLASFFKSPCPPCFFGALIVFLLFPVAVSGQTPDTSSLDAHQFTIGRVGFVGHHTAAERGMQHIASLPDAAEVFQAVIDDRHRSNVAKLYALCGLKQVQGPGFDAAAHQLASLPAQVSVMHGDVMEKESVRQMVHQIRQHLCGRQGGLT